ncbi:bifunctional UDP-N-acetylmuramoyl-tripeptide:D-alanyl-D-alanine ligase/alanine racemase [Natronoflexus pectinivorans]|uniref:Alanine racemase n=1 Tax=Natronoflexus pectinivorans TaxID=682526 RepID=A0A4R2GIF3_9BACT|nr:bifunctional UDP-N-acetylmuramoyl-tripeptide:D-alanyl-D-alanine ligase/alanine racemase [Natronoflexus pectinivorans]TCO07673.1 alanine racemase [Natronoflexus pectinivorans]
MTLTSYSIQQIAQMASGRLFGNITTVVTKLAYDSRLVFNSPGVLFFAIKSSHLNGGAFVNTLYQRGVRAFVVEKDFVIPVEMTDASFIVVDNSLQALQRVAANHRSVFNLPVLAITGSNGKTIVKEWLGQVLGDSVKVTRSPRSFNSQIGVPLSVWQLNDESELGIFEAGISKPGEMEALREILKPTLGLITNIGAAHQENFSSMDEKLMEKLALFKEVDTVFYKLDDELIHHAIMKLYPQKKKLTWGVHPDSNLRLLSSEAENGKLQMTLQWQKKSFSVSLPFPDKISRENALPVILLMLYKGLGFDAISRSMLHLQPVAMRMEQIEGLDGSLIINDSYNSDFTSLEVALDFLEQQGRKKGRQRILILSDLLQTGIEPGILYPRIADLIKIRGVERLIGVGSEISGYASCFRASDTFFKTTEELLAAIPRLSFRNEAILIKGARAFEFERISEQLEQKQHSTCLEINLNALIHNFKTFKSGVNPQTRILAMVKASGYGSGAFEIASALQHHKVDYLGVAFADEGMELRKAGIQTPIMVMSPEVKSFNQMLQYKLEPEIYGFRLLEAFCQHMAKSGEGEAGIHLKVDTGMYRLGFYPEDAEELVVYLKKRINVRVLSVFTHLAGTDDSVHDAFTSQQIGRFTNFADIIEKGLGYAVWRHALNSAGIERFPQYQFDMVRLGIGLYGVSSLPENPLLNVVTLKTYISQIKTVKAGETIGYSRRGSVSANGKIAVLPIGYADGLNRRLSNGVGQVLVRGKLCPIVGNICMDMCMIDVSGMDLPEGEEVVVFGDEHPLTQMAEILDTIPYEVLTSISQRVKRVYFKE